MSDNGAAMKRDLRLSIPPTPAMERRGNLIGVKGSQFSGFFDPREVVGVTNSLLAHTTQGPVAGAVAFLLIHLRGGAQVQIHGVGLDDVLTAIAAATDDDDHGPIPLIPPPLAI